MKKFVSLMTCAAFLFSSVRADDAPPLPPVDTETIIPEPPRPDNTEATIPQQPSDENLATSPEIPDDTTDAPTDDGKKHVGQAANDGSKAAGSGAGKYVLAACAIAVGVAALILVSTHSGHKK